MAIGEVLGLDQDMQEKLQQDSQRLINKGTKRIHGTGSRDGVLGLLGAGNPLEDIANASVTVVQAVDAMARDAGQEIHDLAKIDGALDIVGQVAEVGEASGKTPALSEEQKVTAYAIAVEKYIAAEIAAGRIDGEKLAQEVQAGIQQNMSPEQQQDLDEQIKRISDTAMDGGGQ